MDTIERRLSAIEGAATARLERQAGRSLPMDPEERGRVYRAIIARVDANLAAGTPAPALTLDRVQRIHAYAEILEGETRRVGTPEAIAEATKAADTAERLAMEWASDGSAP